MLFWFHFYSLLLFTTLKGLVQYVLHDVRCHFKSFDVLTIVVGKGACDWNGWKVWEQGVYAFYCGKLHYGY